MQVMKVEYEVKTLTLSFANRHYAYGRWPTGLPLMPSQLSPQSQINLYDCCLYAGRDLLKRAAQLVFHMQLIKSQLRNNQSRLQKIAIIIKLSRSYREVAS